MASAFTLGHSLTLAAATAGWIAAPTQLELTGSSMVVALLAFNIGVELAQLAVIVVVVPSLHVLSRSAVFTPFRYVLSGLAFLAAAGWLLERAFGPANPYGGIEQAASAHLVTGAALLAASAIAASLHRIFNPITQLQRTRP